jgi:AAA+ ATPase superfamily predicted ATPase
LNIFYQIYNAKVKSFFLICALNNYKKVLAIYIFTGKSFLCSHSTVIPSVAKRSRGIFGFERPENSPVGCFQRERADRPTERISAQSGRLSALQPKIPHTRASPSVRNDSVNSNGKSYVYFANRNKLLKYNAELWDNHLEFRIEKKAAIMIGRTHEQQLLKDLADSGEAEFAVVYGRRRVGKTYLVRETFGDDFLFSYTGIAGISRLEQIARFTQSLREQGWKSKTTPHDWFETFDALKQLINRRGTSRPTIVFLDEMPWMDNRKSDFISAFENFWNGWGSAKKNLTLIACGSATAWITKKIFRAKGGLYNRVTRQIHLKPFRLVECREYLASKGIAMNEHDLIEAYMVFGGIPYYLRMLEKRLSLALNIDALCFAESAPLRWEYAQLMSTLFDNPSRYEEVIEAIGSRRQGVTREDITKNVAIPDGGNLTRILAELEESGFIRRYRPYRKKNGSFFQLMDTFVGFYLEFMRSIDSENYWSSFTDNARHRAWSGYAFEQVCLAHVDEIKRALGISGVLTDVSSWRSNTTDAQGAQVDLVIDRNDQVINLLEMKYLNEPLMVDKRLDLMLREKVGAFKRETRTRKAVHLTLVSPYGLKQNRYASVFQSSITMHDLC